MTEEEATNLATLHLDGEAYELWCHGLVTMSHNRITSFTEFTQMLIERFDKKDPKLHSKELAQLRQTDNP